MTTATDNAGQTRWLGFIDNWFEPVYASQDYRRADYILLFMILLVGVWLRFWHLDNVGLHGDEDIMGLAARGVVEHGAPVLPSGMFYPRALLHTYLLAGSTLLFGDNEWALRFPSAVVGSLCGLLAFFMGRRFLDPKPNLAFVAVMTFLPAMIEVSMTARMYVFLIASLMVFAALIFRWERLQTNGSLLLAFLTWLLALQFHPLAIFTAPMFLYPGLANRSRRQVYQGALLLISAVFLMGLFETFTSARYPEDAERLSVPIEAKQASLELLYQGNAELTIALAVIAAIAVVVPGVYGLNRWKEALPAALLLGIGAGACVVLHYHIGLIAILAGALAWRRGLFGRDTLLLILASAICVLAATQFYWLWNTGAFPGRKIFGAFVGTPSIWPSLRFATFSPIGAALLAVVVALAGWRFANRQRMPVFFLVLAIGVWGPLFAIGLFQWNVAERYTIGVLPFFALVLIAGVVYVCREFEFGKRLLSKFTLTTIISIGLLVAIIDPIDVWQVAGNSYRDHPDHKGAAEYLKSIGLDSRDIVIAEDSIVYTYYLGQVDFRVQDAATAVSHSTLRNDTLFGQYTGTPVLSSGQQLLAQLDQEGPGDTYIVSSNEGSEGLKQRNRGSGIAEVLSSNRVEVVYTGRDGATTVWRAVR